MISYFPVVTGSLTVSGSVNISGGITASGGITISGSIDSASFASTASFVALAQSASNAVSAATASYADALTVAGNLTAQTLVVQTITSSVDFVTGSTRFGSLLANTHVFSGSVTMNPGGLFVSGSSNVGIGTTNPRSYKFHLVNSGSNAQFGISNQGTADGDRQLRIGFGGNGANTYAELQGTRLNVADDVNIALQPGGGYVGIGTTSPTSVLEVSSGSNAQTGIRVRNSTAGTSAGVEFGAYTNSGNGGFGKYSTANTPYKNISAASTYVYNGSSGDIALLNDASSGNISFAAGGSSTAHLTIASTGAATFASSVTANNTITTNKAKAGSGIETNSFLDLVQTGTHAIGDSLLIRFGAGGTAYTAQIAGILGADNVAYGSLAFSTRNYFTDSMVEIMRINNRGNVGFFTTSPSGSGTTNLVHINGAGAVLRIGPNYPQAGAGTDRDFIELIADGANTKLISPNETFSILNPGGGAGSWAIDVIAGSGGVRLTNGATSWSSISDIRQKDIIEPITDAISKVSTLSTVIYKFKDDETEQRRVGLIAQEVNEVLPEAVNSFEDEEKMWSVRYTEVIPLLTKAIQELNTKFEEYKATHP